MVPRNSSPIDDLITAPVQHNQIFVFVVILVAGKICVVPLIYPIRVPGNYVITCFFSLVIRKKKNIFGTYLVQPGISVGRLFFPVV